MPPIDPVLQTLIAEAYGEGPEGMRLAAETIVNRSEQRGLTPAEVVQQRRQYSGYENPGPAVRPLFNDPNAISAAQAAWDLARGPGDPTNGANHYFAPGTISTPSWARSMTPTLTHGGHAFYTDRPGYQQQGLGPRVAPSPAQITPSSAALRQMTSPTNGNTALQTALDAYATRERNRVTPVLPEWLKGGMNQGTPPVQSGGLSAAQQDAARRLALQMNQSYAGQSGAGAQNLSGGGLNPAQMAAANRANILSSVGSSNYAMPAGWGNNATQDAARRAALSIGNNQTYAGQSGAGPQNLNSSNRLPASQPGLPANYGTMTPNQVNAIGVGVSGAPSPLNRPTQFASIPNVGPANVGMPRPRPANTSQILPMPANMRPNGAPTPFPKPNFGMGGPGFAPVNAASMAQATAQNNRVTPRTPPWAMTNMNQPAPHPAPQPVAPPRPAVGTIYGIAGNGGLMTQGFNGVNNSITQANFAAQQGMQINPNGTMSLMAGGGPDYVNGVLTGGGNDRNMSTSGGAGKGMVAPAAAPIVPPTPPLTLIRTMASSDPRSSGRK